MTSLESILSSMFTNFPKRSISCSFDLKDIWYEKFSMDGLSSISSSVMLMHSLFYNIGVSMFVWRNMND